MSEPAPAEETPAQKQARLRRERRNAKIQAGGSARLAAIMNSSGRQHAAEAETARPAAQLPQSSPAPVGGTATPDPDIVDISEHHYQPRTTNRSPGPRFESGPQAQQMPPADDPMMAMLQQMMAGAGEQNRDPNAQIPPGLASLFGALGQEQEAAQQPPTSSAYVWRILHFVISLFLALYVTLNTTFTGSKRARELSSLTYTAPLSLERNFSTQLFYLFATAEVVLQSSRYFIEKGRLTQSGIMGTLSQVLPEPWAGYVRVVGRYSVIYTTVVADAMVVVFVLGVMAWWKNGASAELEA
ncbi:uncharacterized protein PV09_02761 [Verruconis gallopava]|uniref:GET complex, subunit GET2 n=1 Tax=Verruconis gallopava TaxID=253628 RepID=A0A0D2AH94_9PEZI|nr:uncharacterized protein PV09_02761 [Verruconis gallopava]KIW06293.1 hypothetical protein PV09_02761 [Verruconis gallopava]